MAKSTLLRHAAVTFDFATKFCFTLSLARNPRWNYKCLELPWYGFWCLILMDLFAGIPECIVFPQFPLWVVPEEDDAEEPGGITAGEASEDQPENVEYSATWDIFGAPGSPSSSSILSSQPSTSPSPPNPPRGFRITDFAVLHLTGVVEREPFHVMARSLTTPKAHMEMSQDVEVSDMLIPFIMENKKEFVEPRRELFPAQLQALEQARYLFRRSPQEYVVAMVASGAFWRWAKITRDHTGPLSTGSQANDPTYEDEIMQCPNWSAPHTFGTPESTRALQTLYALVKALLEAGIESVQSSRNSNSESESRQSSPGTRTSFYVESTGSEEDVGDGYLDRLNDPTPEASPLTPPRSRFINKRPCPSSSSPHFSTKLSPIDHALSPSRRALKKRTKRVILSPTPSTSSNPGNLED